MNLPFAVAFAAAMIASPCCQASGCAVPEREAALADLTSVAAPEMLAATGSLQGCLTAQQMVELIRVDVPAINGPATASAPASGNGPAMVDSNGYVPKTKDDNTPWRFDMHQNGKRMTAEQFDEWMKAKGIHVATGKPTTVAAPDASACQPSETSAC